jgi:excisionase family DNA binding protein
MPEPGTTTEIEPLLVSPHLAQQLLDLSNSAFYGLIRTGEIASVKIGKSRRVPMAAIKDFVARKLAENPANKRRRGRPRTIVRPVMPTTEQPEVGA